MTEERLEELKSLASEIKKDVVRMAGVAHSVPLDVSISLAAFFAYLYWEVMNVFPDAPRSRDRDRFVLGVEAAAPLLYAALARRGFFEREELWHYRRLGAMLQALPDFRRIPGIDAPCVTTGAALSLALAVKYEIGRTNSGARVFCLAGGNLLDDDDFAWEAKRAAALKLDGLVLVVCAEASLFEKHSDELNIMAESWQVASAAGCYLSDIERAFSSMDFADGRPKLLLLRIGGEQLPSIVAGEKHKKSMNAEDMDQALEELEGRTHEKQ